MQRSEHPSAKTLLRWMLSATSSCSIRYPIGRMGRNHLLTRFSSRRIYLIRAFDTRSHSRPDQNDLRLWSEPKRNRRRHSQGCGLFSFIKQYLGNTLHYLVRSSLKLLTKNVQGLHRIIDHIWCLVQRTLFALCGDSL